MAEAGAVPGYGFGAQATARSPLGLEDLDLLKQTVLFTEEDEEYLRLAGDVLEDQVDEVLDLWYGFVGSHPHLIRYFAGPSGEPNAGYLERVRERSQAVDLGHLPAPLRSAVARLPAGDRPAPHARQKEPDRRSGGDSGAHSIAVRNRLRLPDHGNHQAVPRQRGSRRPRRREDARRVVQVGSPASRAVEST